MKIMMSSKGLSAGERKRTHFVICSSKIKLKIAFDNTGHAYVYMITQSLDITEAFVINWLQHRLNAMKT